MRRNTIATLTFLCCIAVILLLSYYFFSSPEPAPDAKSIESIFNLPVSDFQPEPKERKLYVLSVLLLPILCGLFYMLFSRARFPFSNQVKFYAQLLLTTVPILLYVLVCYSLRNTVFPFVELSSFRIRPLLTLVSVTLLFMIVVVSYQLERQHDLFHQRFSFILYYGFTSVLVVLVALETIHGDTEPTIFARNSFEHLHFTAYFDALAQTYLGKSPVALNPQYGYYAFFLNPLFKIIGITILSFTLVMSLLKIIAYSGLLITLRKITKNWLIALLGFGAMLFYTRIRAPLDMNIEPYFQYNPHRLFFPALLIFLVWLYSAQTTAPVRNTVYGVTTLAAAVAVLWNPDTGIITFASWIIVLGYIEVLQLWGTGSKTVLQRILLHLVKNLMALGLVILIVYGQYYLQNGMWPDFTRSFQYTSLFYYYGFYMLPLPRQVHPWMWVILPYIVGIYQSVSHLLDRNRLGRYSVLAIEKQDVQATVTFAISVIGFGVFTYYQGRSHNYNLVSISWPAFLLFTLFTDQLFGDLAMIVQKNSSTAIKVSLLGRYTPQVILLIIFFYFLGSSVTSIALHIPAYTQVISARLARTRHRSEALQEQTAFIKQTSAPTDTILLLTDEATELYLYTDHPRPLEVPGFGEFVLKTNVEKLNEFLAGPPKGTKIYWNSSFQIADPWKFENLMPIASCKDLTVFESVKK